MKNVDTVREALEKAFPDSEILVTDPRGDDQHLAVTVVSPLFTGKARVRCHQMIYEALGDLMKSHLHALTIVTKVPSEEE
jgi:stress-induced morphogen